MTAKELRAQTQRKHVTGAVLGPDEVIPPLLILTEDGLRISCSTGYVRLTDAEFCALLRIGAQWFPEALSESVNPNPKESYVHRVP